MSGYQRTTLRRKYKHPPLVETVFEVRYQSSSKDLLCLGLIAEALKEEFPIAEAFEPKRGVLVFQVGDPLQKLLQLSDELRTISVSLGQGSISVSAVKSGDSYTYIGFETLQQRASLALKALLNVNPDLSPTRLGYRHINHISVPKEKINVGELLDVGIFLPEMFANSQWVQSRFNVQSVLEYQAGGSPLSMAIKLSTKRTPDDNPVLELDFDCFSEAIRSSELEELISWLSLAHDVTGDVFESCITDRLRVEFNDGGNDSISGSNEA